MLCQPKYTTAHPIATKFPVHGFTDNLITEHNFDSQATRIFDVLGFLGDIFFIGAFTHMTTETTLTYKGCSIYKCGGGGGGEGEEERKVFWRGGGAEFWINFSH